MVQVRNPGMTGVAFLLGFRESGTYSLPGVLGTVPQRGRIRSSFRAPPERTHAPRCPRDGGRSLPCLDLGSPSSQKKVEAVTASTD